MFIKSGPKLGVPYNNSDRNTQYHIWIYNHWKTHQQHQLGTLQSRTWKNSNENAYHLIFVDDIRLGHGISYSHFSLCLSLVVFACEPLQIGWPWRLINVSMSHALSLIQSPCCLRPQIQQVNCTEHHAKHYWSHDFCCFPCLISCLLSNIDSISALGLRG